MACIPSIPTTYYLLALVILIITPFTPSSIQSVNAKNYIVTLKSDAGDEADLHYKWMETLEGKTTFRMNTAQAQMFGQTKDVLQTFSIGDVNGYAADLPESWVETVLMNRPEVESVDVDEQMYALAPVKRQIYDATTTTAKQQGDVIITKDPEPNLDMLDTTGKPLFDKKFTIPKQAGAGVKVYVIDTGVRSTHLEFEGRAKMAASLCKGCANSDDNGHGTHVAAIVAGKFFGVANKASIYGVKVLNATGRGQTSEVIAGLQFVGDQKEADKNGIFVANLSLGGPFSKAFNRAVRALTNQGVHVVVAAGNEGRDACKSSPSSEKTAITVGAIEDFALQTTNFTNFGCCVDMFAPGRRIMSAGNLTDNDVMILSGTSQAAPHVAGAAALLLSKTGDMPPASLSKLLISKALQDQIKFSPKKFAKESPNIFVSVRDF